MQRKRISGFVRNNAFLVLLFACYGVAIQQEAHLPMAVQQDYMRVAVPSPVQILLTGGDRYLAADLATVRATMVGTGKLDPDTVAILARVQTDASWMNPAQEDNYYQAAAILPWSGEVESTQIILQRATDARPTDFWPPFFLGFNRQYFYGDYVGAAREVELAADRVTGVNHFAFQAIAARWYEKGDDPQIAIQTLTAMQKSTRDKNLQALISQRIERVQGLRRLRQAAARYAHDQGQALKSLQDLVVKGYLTAIPQDPVNLGYTLDAHGKPVFVMHQIKLQ